MDSKTRKKFGIAGILASALFGGNVLLYDALDKKKALEELEAGLHDVSTDAPEFGKYEKQKNVASSLGQKEESLQRKKPVEKSQEELYSGLFNVFLDCQKKDNYSSFLKDLMLVKKKPIWSFGGGRNSLNEIRAYLEEDKTMLLQQALFDGKFFDAAVLAGEFAVPEEVIQKLYEKGIQCKDGLEKVYFDLPYTEKHFDLQRHAFFRNYLNQAMRFSSPQEGGFSPLLKKRFLDFFMDYSDRIPLGEVEIFIQNYGLEKSVVSGQVQEKLTEAIRNFSLHKEFDVLEEIAAGYGILGRENIQEVVSTSFSDVFSNEYQRRVVEKGIEKDSAEYLYFTQKIGKFKDYLSDDVYKLCSHAIDSLMEK